MSTMLKQAIIDATELRETALKSAESVIIEKYSNEIKQVVDSLLEEQPDPMIAMDPQGATSLPPADQDIVDDMPLASTDGEESCPCPDDDTPVHIDITGLIDQMKAAEASPEDVIDRPYDDVEDELEDDEEIPALEEDYDINEEDLAKLLEDLEIDINPQKSGWLETPTSQIQAQAEEAKALEAHLDEEEEEKVDEEKEQMREALENVHSDISALREENEKYKEVILQLKDSLNEMGVQNARMLYTNQALNSDSLNGQQKNKIVEAIGKASTVEEAKVIYETLQNAVGSASSKRSRAPKSLSEAVIRRSSTLVSRSAEKPKNDPQSDRMRKLAGLS